MIKNIFLLLFVLPLFAMADDSEKFISLNLHIAKEGLASIGQLDNTLSVCEANHCMAIKNFSTDLSQLENGRMEQITYVSNSVIANQLHNESIALDAQDTRFVLASNVRCQKPIHSATVIANNNPKSYAVAACDEQDESRIIVSALLKLRSFAGNNVNPEYIATFKASKSLDIAEMKKYRVVFATGMSGRWRVLTHTLSDQLEPRDYFDALLNSLQAQDIETDRILPRIFESDVKNGELIMDQLLRIEHEAMAAKDDRPILLVTNSRACNEALDMLLEDKYGLLKQGKIKGWLAIQGSFLGTPRVEAGYDIPELRLAIDLLYKNALYSLTAIARDDFMTKNRERIEQLARHLPILSVAGRIPGPNFASPRIETYKALIAEKVDNDGSVPSYSETLFGTDYVFLTGIDHEGFSAQNNYGFNRERSFMALFQMLLKRIDTKAGKATY